MKLNIEELRTLIKEALTPEAESRLCPTCKGTGVAPSEMTPETKARIKASLDRLSNSWVGK